MFGWFKKKPETYSFIGDLNEPWDEFEAHASQRIPDESEQWDQFEARTFQDKPVAASPAAADDSFDYDPYNDFGDRPDVDPNADTGEDPFSPLAWEYLADRPGYVDGDSDNPHMQRLGFHVKESTARIDAEEQIEVEERRYGPFTDARRQELIEERKRELFYALCDAEQTEYYDRRRADADWAARNTSTAQHDELIATIRRGQTAANLGDLAMAHPFLTGLIGTAVFHNLKDKLNSK